MNALSLPLATDRLILRQHREADVSALRGIYAQPAVAKYLLDEPWGERVAREKVTERLAQVDLDGDAGALALVIELEGRPIGDVQLWLTDRERRVSEIGWVLDPGHGGKGYAREAVRAVLEVGFGRYRLHRVAAQMDARNSSSARLAGAVGMLREAHHRQDWWRRGVH